MNHPQGEASSPKLEWLEPTLELLHDPESGPGYETYETMLGGPFS
jgi:hypothetical protein